MTTPAKACVFCVVSSILLLALLPRAHSLPDAKPAPLECRWCQGPIELDGQVKEKAWQGAQVVDKFTCSWEKRPAKTATRARLLWDDKFLYFAADMDDNDLYADVKDHNGQTWTNDVFELFFKPSTTKRAYYEFQVNPLNTQLELFMPSRGAGGYQRFGPITKLGMRSAVQLQGTLNKWQDRDIGWSVEGKLPWSAFEATGGKPKPGDTWLFALCRYDYSADFEAPDLTTTAPLTQASFHRYEDYGTLRFVGP